MARTYSKQQLIALAAADARKYGVGDWFPRQIGAESNFDPNAHSSAGADGIAQFIPSTARSVGLKDPYDPVAALDAAARYDAKLISEYGTVPRALSAYNSGRPDAYQDPNFAKGQTFNYVRSILGDQSPQAGSSMASAQSPLTQAAAPRDLGAVRQALTAAMTGTGLDRSGFYGKLGQALRQQPGQQAAAPLSPAPSPQQPTQGSSLALAAVPGQYSTRGGIQLDQRVLPQADQIAQRFGVKINSGYRSPGHNAQVGGAPNSDHLSGDAVDFTGTPAQMQALYQWAQTQQLPYVEPWAQSKDHVHISLRRNR